MQRDFHAAIPCRSHFARASRRWSIRRSTQMSGNEFALFAKEHRQIESRDFAHDAVLANVSFSYQ